MEMKENGLSYSMASFKEIMASTYIAKLIFDKCGSIPNRKLISHTIRELFGWQRKLRSHKILTNNCFKASASYVIVYRLLPLCSFS